MKKIKENPGSDVALDKAFGPEMMKTRMSNCHYHMHERGDEENPECT